MPADCPPLRRRAQSEHEFPAGASRLSGNKGLQASGFYTLVRLSGEEPGLAPACRRHALFPHGLRRMMARNAYDRTGDLLRIQHWLGHESHLTTAGYIDIHDATNNPAGDAVDYG